jgi:hypothetical protein
MTEKDENITSDKQRDNDLHVSGSINAALGMLKTYRPQERSARSRGYAVCITQMEFIEAYFAQYVQTKD